MYKRQLFKNYAIVFQDVMLFDETVMENIRLGRGDATDEAQSPELQQRILQAELDTVEENLEVFCSSAFTHQITTAVMIHPAVTQKP